MWYLGNQASGAGTPALLLPFARKRGAEHPAARESLKISIEPEVFARLTSAAPDIESALLAVWHTLVWRFTEQSEVVVGGVGLTRAQDQAGTSRQPLTEIIPVAVSFSHEFSLADVMQQVHNTIANARNLKPGNPAQFPIGFVSEELSGNAALRSACSNQFQLSLCVQSDLKTWFVELIYDTACFTRDAAERMARTYATMISACASDPNRCADTLPALSSQDYDQVVVQFNQSAAPYMFCVSAALAQAFRSPCSWSAQPR